MQTVTRKVLDFFDQINRIPRCSGKEEQLARWLDDWSKARNYMTCNDAAGNLVVRVPASTGCEAAPIVILQAHMDMVCEKTPESTHDFIKDPIISKINGEWLTAQGTTLGADNGIAIAYAMALVDDPAVRHPELELLFTVDEESGLTGVKSLQADMLKGRIFINLDSEDEGVFTIGCAGGEETELALDFKTEPLPEEAVSLKIVVGGLTGGHSGIDIHKNRANANKILARVLAAARQVSSFRLQLIKGGSRHNAIARDAEAVIACTPSETADIKSIVDEITGTIQQEYAVTEKQISVRVLDEARSGYPALRFTDTEATIRLLLSLPNGVAGMSPGFPGVVETSNNLATVNLADGRLHILTSQRSSVPSRLREITSVIEAVAGLAGAHIQTTNKYPAWPPDAASSLLQRAKSVYGQQFGKEPIIQVIHAGLECAIIGDLMPGMDMISFGPTIRNPHCPDECIFIPSVEKVWAFLKALLADLAENV